MNNSYGAYSQTERTGGFSSITGPLRRRKWLALVVFASAATAAIACAAFLPSLYKSTVTLVVNQLPTDTTPRTPGVDEIDSRLQAIDEEILSRTRILALIDKLGLYPRLRGRVPDEVLVERTRRDIQIAPKGTEPGAARGSTIALTLTYRGTDPNMAARVANTLAASYVTENSFMAVRQASDAKQVLGTQLDEIRKKQEEQERRIRDFKNQHSGELPQQVDANLSTLERLNSQLGFINDNLMRLADRRDTLQKTIGDAVRGSGKDGVVETPAMRLSKLKSQLAEARARYSDKYPEVIRLQDELAQAQKQMASSPPEDPTQSTSAVAGDPTVMTARNEMASIDAEVRRLRADDRRVRGEIAAYQSRVDGAPRLEQEYKELSRDYETTKDMYGSVLKKYGETQLAQEDSGRSQQFRIVEQASVPSVPIGPNRLRIVIMGLVLSVGLAVGAVILSEQRDTSFHSIDDLRSVTHVPVLASIPPIRSRADISLAWFEGMIRSAGFLVILSIIAFAVAWLASGNDELVRILSKGTTP